MEDLPRPGIEPMFSALAGGLLITGSPKKSCIFSDKNETQTAELFGSEAHALSSISFSESLGERWTLFAIWNQVGLASSVAAS